jgi:hypothetical protein
MYEIQRQTYAKRVGLPGDAELGFDVGCHGCPWLLFS